MMEGQGVKIGSTAIIWSLATGMMAISIHHRQNDRDRNYFARSGSGWSQY